MNATNRSNKLASQIGTAIGAAVIASMSLLPRAFGDLVLEAPAQAASESRESEREGTRQVIGASEKAQATVQAEAAPAPVVVHTAPAHITAPGTTVTVAQVTTPATEVQNLTKAELMRRERIRSELKNEDILQERLEELRLRDENRRTEQLLGSGAVPSGGESVAQAPVQEQVVVPPVTDRPGQPAVAPTGSPALAMASTGTQTDAVTVSHAQATVLDSEEKTQLTLAPRAGLSSMNNSSGYNLQSRYTAGIGLGVGVSDTVTFELGYQFSEYGVAMNSSNYYVQMLQAYNPTYETLALKQNVVDAGLKVHVLGSDAKLRPFVGGGAAYSKSYINYDQRIITSLTQAGLQNMARDYELSSYLGYLSTGLDVRLTKRIAVGAVFKYYTVLTARENQNLNNAAFTGYSPYYYGYGGGYAASYYTSPDVEKAVVGGSLSRSSFYSILAGVSFTF